MRVSHGSVILLLSAIFSYGCVADDPGPPLAVGFGAKAIAPSASQIASNKVFLGAYGVPLTRHGTAIHDATWARAMAIQSRHEKLLLIALDAPVLSEHFIRDVSLALGEELGLRPAQVLIGATHSHSAPDLMGLWGGVPEDYRADIVRDTVAAGREAWQARVPATIEAATGEAKNRNRRGWKETDTAMTVLRAVDLSGKILGALVNFAAHPIFLDADNMAISRDFCGYLVDALAHDIGAPVIYFNGIVGDVSPSFSGDGDAFARAKGYGEAMAAEAAATLARPGVVRIEEGLVVREARWTQTIDNAYFSLAKMGGLLKEFDLDESGGTLKIEIAASYFRLGDEVDGVSFPGEALTRTGLPIKAKMKANHKLFFGLTRATLGYFIRSDEWKTGRNDDYEETVSPGPDAGDQAVAKIGALIDAAATR